MATAVASAAQNPVDENATIDDAYNQLQTYKDEIPSLFRTNGLLITSDGLLARVGSLTANSERFMAWRTVDGELKEQVYDVALSDNRTIDAKTGKATVMGK